MWNTWVRNIPNHRVEEPELIRAASPGVTARSCLKKSLVVQWLKIHLAVQATPVQSLVQEDPTCCGADRLFHRNC